MKAKSLSIPLLVLGLAGVYGAQENQAKDREQQALKQRVDDLEKRLSAVEVYLQAQSKSAVALGEAVDQAVEQGFTAGINPRSRDILVEAWKNRVKAASTAVPGVRKETPPERVDPRILRRQGEKSGQGQ